MREAKVTGARMLTAAVRELTFDPGPGFAFVPGQWVSFRIPQPDGTLLNRAYSIASPPRADGRFDVAVTRVEGGPGSQFLHGVEPGATLAVTEAQGFFTLAPLERPVLLIATGTGVAPLRSMLLAALAQGATQRFVLLLGVRTEADVLYGEEFARLAAERPAFRFEPTLSRPSPTWTGRRGYVQTHVPELAARLGGDVDVYVCGLNRMIREVRAVLKGPVGLPRERIHTERYD